MLPKGVQGAGSLVPTRAILHSKGFGQGPSPPLHDKSLKQKDPQWRSVWAHGVQKSLTTLCLSPMNDLKR